MKNHVEVAGNRRGRIVRAVAGMAPAGKIALRLKVDYCRISLNWVSVYHTWWIPQNSAGPPADRWGGYRSTFTTILRTPAGAALAQPGLWASPG